MKYVSISTTLLGALVSMASAHVEDVESGVAEGIYKAEDNQDVSSKRESVDQAQQILEVAETRFDPAHPEGTFHERLLEEFPELLDDGEISGADMVDFVSLNLEPLRAETEARALGEKNTVPAPYVDVQHWRRYHEPTEGATMSHGIEITDQRQANGQVYIDICALAGHMDEMICAVAEVNGNPLVNEVDGMDQPVPCLHVNFDEDNLAFSVFRVRDRLMVRPEADTKVTSEVIDSPTGLTTVYWIG